MIAIGKVTERAEREEFIRLPGRLAVHDPNRVEELWFERRQFLDPGHNPYFAHAEVALWLARREGRIVGRISTQMDRLAPVEEGRRIGHFGMLAAEDPETVRALLTHAEGWIAERGGHMARGPFSLSINQTTGVLVEGFGTPPSVMMAHDPDWLGAAIGACGYDGARDLVAYRLDVRAGLPDRPRRHATRLDGEGVVVRSLDMRRYREEIATITTIFNDAWAGNWGFVPLTEAEIGAMARDLKPILDPELVKIAEVNGAPAAFIVLLPNINEAIADLGGRLLPFGWLKLLWRLKVRGLRSARVPLMGVRREISGSLLGKTLPLKLIYALEDRARARRIEELELSWLLAENWPVRRVVESIGGRLAKTYRVYERLL